MINKKWLKIQEDKVANNRPTTKAKWAGHKLYSQNSFHHSHVEEGKQFKSAKEFTKFLRTRLAEQEEAA